MYISADDPKYGELIGPYELLMRYATPVKKMERELVGRSHEMAQLMSVFNRPEISNVMLLAEAGTGKTAIVQGCMAQDKARYYLEVNLSKMIADVNNPDEIASILKDMFDEATQASNKDKHELVMFMDEFHQIVHLSAAAVEAMKPILADSGTRGLHIVAATTYGEFREYISPNQPLVERFQRLNVVEPDKETCIEILDGMAQRYDVKGEIDPLLYGKIYEYTNRYIPANAQPRKSILLLDAMVGWYRSANRKLDERLLADVIFEQEGVNVSFRVDAATIKERLDKRVLAQQFATSVIEQRLQLCVADLNDHSKPQSTFLFTGSTGTGKTEMSKQLANILFGNSSRSFIRLDCTEFANNDSLDRFRDTLTTQVWERPYSLIMLDEIEKAAPTVTRILLQVLDDGRLTDRNGRETSFINSYIVLTTNAGSEIYKSIAQYESSDTGSGEFVGRYESLIRHSLISTTGGNRFPPELLGRVDAIVPFQPLSEKTMERIAKLHLYELKRKVLKDHHVELDFDKRVLPYIVADNLTTDSDAGGARAVISKIESEIACAVARFLNQHSRVVKIYVSVEGVMSVENKNQLTSNAYIKVEGKA